MVGMYIFVFLPYFLLGTWEFIARIYISCTKHFVVELKYFVTLPAYET